MARAIPAKPFKLLKWLFLDVTYYKPLAWLLVD